MANENTHTTSITSITPPNLELFKASLSYRETIKPRNRYVRQQKYQITIELSVVESDSAEYSAEDELSEWNSPRDGAYEELEHVSSLLIENATKAEKSLLCSPVELNKEIFN